MCVRVFVSHPQPERETNVDRQMDQTSRIPIEEPTTGQKPRNFNYVVEFRVRLRSSLPNYTLNVHFVIITE